MLNRVTIQGRLCADPELRQTQSGTPVCSFRLAWSEKYKETETKLFLSCTAWRGTGELVSRHFRKGQEILAEGRLTTRSWTDQNGNSRQSNELTVERVHFCGPKQAGEAPQPPAQDYADVTDDDGDLPF